jgi:hypothetical protein
MLIKSCSDCSMRSDLSPGRWMLRTGMGSRNIGRLVDLVVPLDQKLGIGPTRDGHRSGPTSGEIDYQVQLVV